MSIDFTLRRFPVTGALKDTCGLPFACVVQPFAKVERSGQNVSEVVNVKDVARCRDCYAYINHYCGVEKFGWVCALCGAYNEHSVGRDARYIKATSRANCPELRKEVVELQVDLESDGFDEADQGLSVESRVEGSLAYVVLVDGTAELEAMELIKSAIEAAIEAVPPTSAFGIITFASKLGLYDVRGDMPCVRYVSPSGGTGGNDVTLVDLEEALPLDCLLVPLRQYKAQLLSALDSLDAVAENNARNGGTPPTTNGTSGGASFSEADLHPVRPFGVALQSVLRYLSGFTAQQEYRQLSHLGASSSAGPGRGRAAEQNRLQCAGVRLINFLCGPPNHGPGAVLVKYVPPPDDQGVAFMLPDVNPYIVYAPGSMPQMPHSADPPQPQVIKDPKSREFYVQMSSAAAALGVCIDSYAVGGGFMGLDMLEPLATLSGGVMHLYPTPEEAALPQDIYKRLSSPFAFQGLLRFRSSAELSVRQGYGHLMADRQYENLYHIVTCTPHDTYCFDLEYSSAAGFSEKREVVPMLQLVFQYCMLTPVEGEEEGTQAIGQAEGSTHTRYVVERRVRIYTLPIYLCDVGQQVYEAANVEACVAVLMHKVLKLSAETSKQEAQHLLRDWLVNLVSRYHLVMGLVKEGQPVIADVTFDAMPKLQSLPRLVYALIHSPLLSRTAIPGVHPDMRAAVNYLWSCLTPEELCRAIYPVMSSYVNPDKEAFSRHSLSRAALVTAGAPIFLIDSYNSLIVYYVAGYSAALPFPPPHQSLLRKTITHLKQQRRLTPQVTMVRAGVDDVHSFDALLLEDAADSGDVYGAEASGYVAFLSTIRSEAEKYLQAVLAQKR